MSHMHKGRLAQINDQLESLHGKDELSAVATAQALAAATATSVISAEPVVKNPRVASRVPRTVRRK